MAVIWGFFPEAFRFWRVFLLEENLLELFPPNVRTDFGAWDPLDSRGVLVGSGGSSGTFRLKLIFLSCLLRPLAGDEGRSIC